MHPIDAPSPYQTRFDSPRLHKPSLYFSNPACAAAIAVITLIGLAACSANGAKSSERFPYIRDPNFKVENPSRDRASATGIGCGGTEREALAEARETARYNLRGVTGNANYEIRYHVMVEFSKKNKICMEVKATAVDAI